MLVREIMTPDPVACVPTDRVVTAAKIMVDRNCGSVPVVDSQESRRVVGILTDRDIVVRVVARQRNLLAARVRDCMSENVCTVRPTDSIEMATRLMDEKQIRRLPVVDESGRLVGILATADLARLGDERTLGAIIEEISRPAVAV